MLLFTILLFPVNASADIGAKPSIYIKILHAPEHYYVALLDDWAEVPEPHNTEIRDFDKEKETVQEYLENFSYENWTYFTSVRDSNYYESNSKNAYDFGYSVPNPFRIIVIDENGPVQISEVFDKREFNASVTYNYKTNKITEHYIGKKAYRVIQVIFYFLMTLYFEWIVFTFFNFPKDKLNIIVFLVVNTITNLPYNIFKIYFLNKAGWPGMYVAGFLEIIIMLFEAIVYSFLLVTDKGKPEPKCFGYGIAANIFSIMMGFLLMVPLLFIDGFINEVILHS